MDTPTPFHHEAVLEIIAHINGDHADEVMTFALYDAQLRHQDTPLSAKLTQIYEQGLEFLIQNQAGEHTFFFEFKKPLTDIDHLQKSYLTLLKIAGKATGRPYVIETQDHLLVRQISHIGNFVRITALLPDDTPTDQAGFAYLFKVSDTEMRYYTLRRAWHSKDGDGNDEMVGEIDIFTHGDTAGSVWANSLKAGDHLISNRRYPEKTTHLHGQVLLIGDETSLPTVFRILELQQFDNPIVIACLHDTQDTAYLQECPCSYHLLSYNTPMELLLPIEQLITKQSVKIDSVWTAMESKLIKKLRASFKDNLQLDREDMVVKVYWRLD